MHTERLATMSDSVLSNSSHDERVATLESRYAHLESNQQQLSEALSQSAKIAQQNNENLTKHIDQVFDRLNSKIDAVSERNRLSPATLMGLAVACVAALGVPMTAITIIGSMAIAPVREGVIELKGTAASARVQQVRAEYVEDRLIDIKHWQERHEDTDPPQWLIDLVKCNKEQTEALRTRLDTLSIPSTSK